MKYLPLLLLILVVSCTEDPLPGDCQIVTYGEKGNGYDRLFTYTYDDSGKLVKQVQSEGTQTLSQWVYDYTSDGKIDKEVTGNYRRLYEYTPDGKLAVIRTYEATGPTTELLVEVENLTWSTNKLEISFTPTGKPNPTYSLQYDFLNDNVVTRVSKVFTGDDPNRLTNSEVIHYGDFDTAPSLSNAYSISRKANDMRFSKNNPRTATIHGETYNPNGTVLSSYDRSEIYTYTYNASNSVETSRESSDGPPVDTKVTFGNCH